ncbi:MAG: hypothetical protein AAF639_33870 [Chloroflexota bacterium]
MNHVVGGMLSVSVAHYVWIAMLNTGFVLGSVVVMDTRYSLFMEIHQIN